MKERLLFLGTALALISYGCGSSDGGGEATRPITNPAAEQAADRVVDSTQSLSELKSDPGSGNALGGLSSLYGDLSLLASAGTTGIVSATDLTIPKAGLDTCVSSTGDVITYADCDFGVTNIDGSIGVVGDTISTDLSINTAAVGTGVAVTMLGSITVTPSLLTGSIRYETNLSGIDLPGGFGGISLDATYNDVGFDGQGCPTSGSVTVRQAAVGGYDFGDVRAEFGPNCGDIQLFN